MTSDAPDRDPTPLAHPVTERLGPSGERLAQTGKADDHADANANISRDEADRWRDRVLAGRYALGDVLGRGGMGIVYAARHVTIERDCAVKVLRADLSRSPDAVARFHREAKSAAAIGNDHIVQVFDYGTTPEGDAYLVMERLEGEDLGHLVRSAGALPIARAVDLARQVAGALAAAHERGIVHRDLKSENVYVTRREGKDFAKLLDFGISKVLDGSGASHATSVGALMGTPHYMAPEQATDGADIDHRIDLYALGVILFEMLTGRLPFGGANPVEVVYKQVHAAPPAVRSLRPEVPASLAAIVQRALSKNRDHRFADARAMLAALDAVDLADRAPVPKRRAVLVAAAVLGVGAVVAAALASRPGGTAANTHVNGTPAPPATSPAPGPVSSAPTVPVQGISTRNAVPVRIRVVPAHALVLLDNARVTPDSPLALVPGTAHALVVEAAGYVTQRRHVSVEQAADITVTLARQTLAPSTPSRSAVPPVVAVPEERIDDTAGLKISPYAPRR